MSITLDGSAGITSPKTASVSINFGVVGDRRNLEAWSNDNITINMSYMSHLLSDASNNLIALRGTTALSMDITKTGLGGMVGGAVGNGGYIAVYHVYRPSGASEGLVGINCDNLSNLVTRVPASELFPGAADLPSSYVYSALVGVYYVAKDTKILRGFYQSDRRISTVMLPLGYAISASIPFAGSTILLPYTYLDGTSYPTPESGQCVPPPANAKVLHISSAAWVLSGGGPYTLMITPNSGAMKGGFVTSWFSPTGGNGNQTMNKLLTSYRTTGININFIPLSGAIPVKHGFGVTEYEI